MLAASVRSEGPLAKRPHLSICFNSQHNLPGVTEPQGCPSHCQYTHTHTHIGIPFVSTWTDFCSIHKNTVPVYLIDCQTSPAVFARKCAGVFRLRQISLNRRKFYHVISQFCTAAPGTDRRDVHELHTNKLGL